jgi:hypothetical protein
MYPTPYDQAQEMIKSFVESDSNLLILATTPRIGPFRNVWKIYESQFIQLASLKK